MYEQLDVTVDWMQLPPQKWHQSLAFMHFKNLVDSLDVVNYFADQSIKDVTEFIRYSEDENCK